MGLVLRCVPCVTLAFLRVARATDWVSRASLSTSLSDMTDLRPEVRRRRVWLHFFLGRVQVHGQVLRPEVRRGRIWLHFFKGRVQVPLLSMLQLLCIVFNWKRGRFGGVFWGLVRRCEPRVTLAFLRVARASLSVPLQA